MYQSKEYPGYMYKKDFAAELSSRTGLDEQSTDQVISAFLEILIESWCVRTPVCFRGFGTFETRATSERLARNPMTMEDVMIPAGYKPIFKPSKRLRAKVNQGLDTQEQL